ncbi:TPA: hypothetical protein OTX90_004772 [Klebsiella pneumoniae]|nr:hypothetical protein [Klebsiella pneumoniae]HCT5409711.1 hypothetical protein [Klebsiella pneumoniae]
MGYELDLPSGETSVNRLHVHTDHVGHLLPGSAVLQHSAALLHHFFSHYPAASAYSPWHVRSTEEILAAF